MNRLHRRHRPEPVPARGRPRRQRHRHGDRRRRARRRGPGRCGLGAAAEIIIVDCSGSMECPQTKIAAARAATAAAVDAIRDGVRVRGRGGHQQRLAGVPAGRDAWRSPSAATRAEAKQAVAEPAGRRRHRDRAVAAAGLPDLRHSPADAAARDPAHRRRNQHETPEQLARGDRAVRRHVQLRLPRRRHRLGGSRAAPDLRRRCSAPSTSWPTRPGWPPTSPR